MGRQTWRLPRGAGIAAALTLIVASVAYGAVRGGHLPVVMAELRDFRDSVANLAGFRITSIALAGQRRLSREDVLTTAGITGRSSLLFLDASEARARLKANPWIADATVLKLYPGRLHIAVTERDAFALWQRDGKVEVIADDGTVVEPYAGQHFAKLPLVVGVGAETRAKDFLAMLDKYPSIRDQLHAAVLVAERRWNVMLKNGIDVQLPAARLGTGARHAAQARPRQQDLEPRHRHDRSAPGRSGDRAAIGRGRGGSSRRAQGKNPKKKGGAA